MVGTGRGGAGRRELQDDVDGVGDKTSVKPDVVVVDNVVDDDDMKSGTKVAGDDLVSVSVSGRCSELLSDEPGRGGGVTQGSNVDKERADGVGVDDLDADLKPRGLLTNHETSTKKGWSKLDGDRRSVFRTTI